MKKENKLYEWIIFRLNVETSPGEYADVEDKLLMPWKLIDAVKAFIGEPGWLLQWFVAPAMLGDEYVPGTRRLRSGWIFFEDDTCKAKVHRRWGMKMVEIK